MIPKVGAVVGRDHAPNEYLLVIPKTRDHFSETITRSVRRTAARRGQDLRRSRSPDGYRALPQLPRAALSFAHFS